MRSPVLFLEDIEENIKDIEGFMIDILKEEFLKNKEKQNAVIRSLEIIGEAVKNLTYETTDKYPQIEWKKIAGFRDVLSHRYFGADLERIWNVIIKDIPKLKKDIQEVIEKEKKLIKGKEK